MTPRTALLLLAALAVSGCASAPKHSLAGNPLGLRQAQSREYTDCDTRSLMRATLSTFQDENFTIVHTEPDLGLITATQQSVTKGAGAAWQAFRWTSAVFTYGASLLFFHRNDGLISQVEATARIDELGGGQARLRVSFQVRTSNKNGKLHEVRDITDPAPLQAFLAAVDRNLFLQREKL
jgi:hypothetical protein